MLNWGHCPMSPHPLQLPPEPTAPPVISLLDTNQPQKPPGHSFSSLFNKIPHSMSIPESWHRPGCCTVTVAAALPEGVGRGTPRVVPSPQTPPAPNSNQFPGSSQPRSPEVAARRAELPGVPHRG